MNKRGPIIVGIGTVLVLISFGIIFVILSDPDPTMGSELFAPNLLEEIFDHVSTESTISPGGSATFTYSGQSSAVPLVWGAQIVDFEEGDAMTILVSNAHGDTIDSVKTDEPLVFDVFEIEAGSYDFEVRNTGDRTMVVMMMFAEDPENSNMLDDPDSPLVSIVMPLAISGIFLLIGAIVMIVGTVLLVVDWKKEKNRPSY